MVEDTHPNFAIVGAARSGSTAVAEALRGHPDAFVCQPKEPHYYAFAGQSMRFAGPGDDATINRVALTKRDEFLALFAGSADHVARGDGSVSSLYYPDHAIDTIRDINPAMRIIIILRHPVERAYSSYQYLRVRGFEPQPSFLDAVAEEDSRRQANWHHLWHYTSMSYYAEPVGRFIDAFGREQVGVWFYDDLVSDPSTCINGIFEFLKLDPRLAPAAVPRVNASGTPRRKSLQKLIGWASRHESLRRGLKAVVPFGVREGIRSANLQPSTPSPEELRVLAPLFREDLAKLEVTLERSLPGWTDQQ